jgi:hypothetical protein
MAATPTIAAAQRAAPTAPVAAVAPIGESVDGDNEAFGRGGFILPLIVIVVVILGIIVATDDNDDDDEQVSPG